MWMAALSVAGVAMFAPMSTAQAQGGLNKVAHDVSKTMKKAGRDTKAEVKRDASKTHSALTKAGNDTKTAAGEVTGIHKVGGDVGKAAKKVSGVSKKTGAKAKHTVKHAKAAAHADLTKTGKAIKDTVKTP